MASELGLTIQSTLEAYAVPTAGTSYFAKVFKGEPLALTPTAGQPLARWRVLRSEQPPEGERNLKGRRMTVVVYGIQCLWPLSPIEDAQGTQEDDIAAVLVDLPTKFIALTATAYTIGGYAVALLTVQDISQVERAAPFANDVEMRTLEFELHARVLEA